MSSDNSLDRRDFLRKASAVSVALGTAGAALAAKGTKSSSARSSGRVLGANDRINIGVIGVGGRGTYDGQHIRQTRRRSHNPARSSLVCDVYQKRAQPEQGTSQVRRLPRLSRGAGNCRISTRSSSPHRTTGTPPSRWPPWTHGKDVYLEKPMCHTIDEAHKLVRDGEGDRARHAGRFADHFGRPVGGRPRRPSPTA